MSLPFDKLSQYGVIGLEPKGIVIHNSDDSRSAQDLFNEYLESSQNSECCHYLVDDTGIIGVMPEDWKTWSTGKGNDYAFENCLVINICDCIGFDQSEKAEKNAIYLIKILMDRYSIDKEKLYFHIEFNERAYCPHILLTKYITKQNFVERNFN